MVAENTEGGKAALWVAFCVVIVYASLSDFLYNDSVKERINAVEAVQNRTLTSLKETEETVKRAEEKVKAECQRIKDEVMPRIEELKPEIDDIKEAQNRLKESFEEGLKAIKVETKKETVQRITEMLETIGKEREKVVEARCRRLEEVIMTRIKMLEKDFLEIRSSINAKYNKLLSLLEEGLNERKSELGKKTSELHDDINELKRLIGRLNAIVEEIRRRVSD